MSNYSITYPNNISMIYSNTSGNTLSISATGVQLTDSDNSTLLNSDGLSNNNVFDISLNALTFKGATGASGYIVMADSLGAPYWTSLLDHERQNLYNVLSLNNGASGLGITGLSDLTFTHGVTLSSTTENNLSIQTPTSIPVTSIHTGLTGYLPITINGNNYYLQLYSAN